MNPFSAATAPHSRRSFLRASLVACGAAISRGSSASVTATAKPQLLGFSKPFAHFSPSETADLVSEVGWDGIDCPIRSRAGHIAPERAPDELPRMIEALASHGKSVAVVTTDITQLNRSSERLLTTLAQAGVTRYRLGFKRYLPLQPVQKTLEDFGARLKELHALNVELGLQCGYQNHSGPHYLGGPIWDFWNLMQEIEAATIGFTFDIGHAVIEGGRSWPLEMRITRPRWCAIQVKDFAWEQDADRKWRAAWRPLGQGMLPAAFFTELQESGYSGPVVQHHEYLERDSSRADLLSACKRDCDTLREALGIGAVD